MYALVTGSSGFLGRHMVKALEAKGYRVCTWDIAEGNDAHELFKLEYCKSYDLVVHGAYHVGGRKAIDGKPILLARNLELDSAMFNWAIRTKQKRVLYFSSSAAYPKVYQTSSMSRALKEDDIDLRWAAEPDANYGWAKLTGERVARNAKETGLPVHVVRPFSGYGEDQSLDYPFPSIMQRAKKKAEPFDIWGSLYQKRDWIHVDDVVAGCLAIIDADYQEPVNLCTGIGTSMMELANLACSEVGHIPRFRVLNNAPMGVMYRVGDPTNFHKIYTPKISIAEGVKRAMNV